MGTRRSPPAGKLRISYEEIVARIVWFIDEKEPENGWRKRFYEATNLTHPGFSQRCSEYRGQRFTIEHLGAMAAAANWPEPFPFVEWDDASAFDAMKKLMKATRG